MNGKPFLLDTRVSYLWKRGAAALRFYMECALIGVTMPFQAKKR